MQLHFDVNSVDGSVWLVCVIYFA